jgi:glutathione S-transferase
MNMDIALYYAPGSCSRATFIVLEEIGIPYEAKVLAFRLRENQSAEYLALNPKGKVPLIVVDGKPLTESAAIYSWMAETFPDSRLLPHGADPFERAKILADLTWATSALHALIARLRFPVMLSDTPEAIPGIFRMASEAMAKNFAIIEARLSDRDWWHGDWSVQDAYLFWVWTRSADAGFDASGFPRFARHAELMLARPSVQRALAREQLGEVELAARGASLNIPNFAPRKA